MDRRSSDDRFSSLLSISTSRFCRCGNMTRELGMASGRSMLDRRPSGDWLSSLLPLSTSRLGICGDVIRDLAEMTIARDLRL